jgi:hypothetical protein
MDEWYPLRDHSPRIARRRPRGKHVASGRNEADSSRVVVSEPETAGPGAAPSSKASRGCVSFERFTAWEVFVFSDDCHAL